MRRRVGLAVLARAAAVAVAAAAPGSDFVNFLATAPAGASDLVSFLAREGHASAADAVARRYGAVNASAAAGVGAAVDIASAAGVGGAAVDIASAAGVTWETIVKKTTRGKDTICYLNQYPSICSEFCPRPGQCDWEAAFVDYHGSTPLQISNGTRPAQGTGAKLKRHWGCPKPHGPYAKTSPWKPPGKGPCAGIFDINLLRNTGVLPKLPTWPTRMIGKLRCSVPTWHKDPPLANGQSIALFTYNFGNYRNEMGGYTRFNDFKNFTHRYYFVLEAETGLAENQYRDGWVVCGVPDDYIPPDAFPTHRPRPVPESWELTKWFKFGHVPEVLSGYDYIQHMDASFFRIATGDRRNAYRLPSLERLGNIFAAHPTHEAFLVTHPVRHRVPQEWAITKRNGMEHAVHVCAFENAVRGKFGSHAVDLAPMASLGQWVRKVRGVSEGLDLAFRDTFHALTSFGLKRDQNVYIFALYARLAKNVENVVKLCLKYFPDDTCPSVSFHGDVVQGFGGALDDSPYDEATNRCHGYNIKWR